MPIYEYRCSECGEEFEKLVASARSAAEISCPKCGSANVKKMLSLFASRGSAASSTRGSSCLPTGGG